MTTSSASATEVRQRHARRSVRADKFRPDIQGLRAIAVSMVFAYHLWPGGLTGGFTGVDVFFVISGFLITSHLYGRPPRNPRGLAEFWSRRIRRLLPASLLVLASTIVMTRVVAPETRWDNTAWDTISAAVYVVNWRLASNSVDYLAAEAAPSAAQHFWSLAVEEQFYFVWPVLMLLLVAVAVRRRWNRRAVTLAGLGLVTATSLMYSVHATAKEPASAYFVTPTRVWELGLGGLLAVAVAGRRDAWDEREGSATPTPVLRALIAWFGLAAIGVTAFTFSGQTPFPGWRALLPVLGTVAVIAAQPPDRPGSPGALLARRPVQWLGDVSYSLYLWHWPLIVLVPFVSGGHLGALDAVVIIVTALVLSGLTKTYVEDRFRTARWGIPLRRPFVLGATGMAVVVALGVALVVNVDHRQSDARAELAAAVAGGDPCFGAAALAAPRGQCEPTRSGPVVPAPAQAADDKSAAYERGCWEYVPFDGTKKCVFGDPGGDVSIALVGNSHAGQWLPPLREIARQRGWKITTFLASRCTATTIPVDWDTNEKVDGCLDWADRVLEDSSKDKYDLIVTSERNSLPPRDSAEGGEYATYESGYLTYLKSWLAADANVFVIHDTPFPASTGVKVPDCIAEHQQDLAECSGPRKTWVVPDPLVGAAEKLDDDRLSSLDLTDRICRRNICPAAVGGVTTYFDGSHLTRTYGKTLAPYLADPLARAVRRASR